MIATKITKFELTQANSRLAVENASLRARVSQLENDIVNVTSVASAINTKRTPAVDKAWADYITAKRAKMARAREAAMTSGTCVKVSF